MRSLMLFAVLIVHVYSAPQFITFKEGKLGVNFGGYHAAVGLGGLLGGGGTGGGLFAEAGTPFGPAARAGLGGSVDGYSGPAGGLYAGATAGGNVNAEAGLGGEVRGERTAGGGFASAAAGGSHAATGLGGETSVSKSAGFTFSSSKTVGVPTVVKEKEIVVLSEEDNSDVINEITPSANVKANAEVHDNIHENENAQPAVIIKEVYVEPPPTTIVEKHIIRTHKPHRHHVHKTAYVGGFIGGGFGEGAIAPAPVQPAIERRVDVGAEANVNAGAEANKESAGEVTYTKRVSVASNPNFFQDIFNIPISTLKAVGNLLTNAVGSTNVSVQKTASAQAGGSVGGGVGAGAEPDLISPKHASSSSSSSSEAHISVQTPSVSKVIDDIFSIPINTLTAVNKFLENNVGRKRVQVSQEETAEPTRVRRGPHARRRANKEVVIIQESSNPQSEA